jgi:6,7-dimethyl-8-ribityllumazine synthase
MIRVAPQSTMSASNTVKDYPLFPDKFDGSSLRIAIVHARWNESVIDALINGAVSKIKESGVKEHNIFIQSVAGSFELPLACQRCASFPALPSPTFTIPVD